MRDQNDASLMEACARREPEALEELVCRYGDAVYRLTRGILGQDADAEDVTSECFWRLYETASRFDCSRQLRPWILRIAANLARSRLRASRPEVSLDCLEMDPVLPDVEPVSIEAEVLDRALAGLPEDYRVVLALRYSDDLPVAEIAAALGATVMAVEGRLHRARQALRRQIRSIQNEECAG